MWFYNRIINVESGSGALIIYCQMPRRWSSVRITIVIQGTLHADYPSGNSVVMVGISEKESSPEY